MSERVLLEVHAHTKESSRCGWLPAREVISALHAAGYGAAVITDHYLHGERTDAASREQFLEGYRQAREAGEALRMVVLPGIEIRFKDKIEDYLVYGMEAQEILDLPDDVCEQGLRAFHSLSQQKGWLVYQAHPFRPKMLPANPSDIDGIEIFNGNPRHDSQNRLAAAFATRHTLRTIAGTDVHRKGDVGAVGLLVPREALTPRGFADWLRATPHPRIRHQEPPVNGIRYVAGAIPGERMLEALYADAGWTSYTEAMRESVQGIQASLRVVSAFDDTALVGFARAVGDGHTVVLVQDILVLGAYQGRGIGKALMRRLLAPFDSVRQVIMLGDDSPRTREFCRACGLAPFAGFECAGYLRLR